jgi:ribosomal protein S18 acetylase RimI-like enzyme
MAGMELRAAAPGDIEAVAGLHADSWRRNYRGAFLDSFLDGDVFTERAAVWTERLTHPEPTSFTIVAEHAGDVVGFSYTKLDQDPRWGALLDNLHVTHAQKRLGIGTRLVAETARELGARAPRSGLYLFVLAQNTAAQAFYAARGGVEVDREVRGPFPGGGTAPSLRIAWPDPSVLLGLTRLE